jgi:hypothetical protein
MNGSTQPNGKDWNEIVGAFLINFGAVEMVLLNWIIKFSTDAIVRDIAIELPMNKRLGLVCDLIKRSTMSEERKGRALWLWGEIGKFSQTRNILAHSPFITNNKTGESGFIDVKKLKGQKPVEVTPLLFMDIAAVGRDTAKILKELLEESWLV